MYHRPHKESEEQEQEQDPARIHQQDLPPEEAPSIQNVVQAWIRYEFLWLINLHFAGILSFT
jgi:hypothetical protein